MRLCKETDFFTWKTNEQQTGHTKIASLAEPLHNLLIEAKTNPTQICQHWELNHDFIEMLLAGSQDNFPDHCV